MKTKTNFSGIFLIGFLLAMFFLPQTVGAETSARHKNGVLINDNGTIYLLQNDTRRGFATAEEFLSHGYVFAMVVPANAEDMKLPQGDNLKARSGTLVLDTADNKTVYLMLDDGAHPFPNIEQLIFYVRPESREIYSINLSTYPKAGQIGFDFYYFPRPAGILVDLDGTVYLITPSGKSPFSSQEMFFSYGYDYRMVVQGNDGDRRKAVLPVQKYRDGTLVDDKGTVFLISEGEKFGFKTWQAYLAAGYGPGITTVGDTAGYPEGESFE